MQRHKKLLLGVTLLYALFLAVYSYGNWVSSHHETYTAIHFEETPELAALLTYQKKVLEQKRENFTQELELLEKQEPYHIFPNPNYDPYQWIRHCTRPNKMMILGRNCVKKRNPDYDPYRKLRVQNSDYNPERIKKVKELLQEVEMRSTFYALTESHKAVLTITDHLMTDQNGTLRVTLEPKVKIQHQYTTIPLPTTSGMYMRLVTDMNRTLIDTDWTPDRCYNVPPRSAPVTIGFKPKSSGSFPLNVEIVLYETPECSGTPVYKGKQPVDLEVYGSGFFYGLSSLF